MFVFSKSKMIFCFFLFVVLYLFNGFLQENSISFPFNADFLHFSQKNYFFEKNDYNYFNNINISDISNKFNILDSKEIIEKQNDYVSLKLAIQKMPLKETTTFVAFRLPRTSNIYIKTKTSFDKLNKANTTTLKASEPKSGYNADNYKTLSFLQYIIVFACVVPFIIVAIILLVPSKKISDELIAYDLNKKNKQNNKRKLGIQNSHSSPKDFDDEKL